MVVGLLIVFLLVDLPLKGQQILPLFVYKYDDAILGTREHPLDIL